MEQYINVETGQYPIYRRRIELNHPDIIFPKAKPINHPDYALVNPVNKPAGDVVTEGAPERVDGEYQQTWQVRPFTAEESAAQVAALVQSRLSLAKTECSRRIVAVIDLAAQANLTAAAAAQVFSPEQVAVYQQGVQWIAQTRAAQRPLAEDLTAEISDDQHWPAPPPAVVALAAQF